MGTMDAPIKNKSVADEGTKASSARPLHTLKMATELEIRDSIAAVRDALDRSGCRKPNTWVFFSNKNDQLLTIEGDLYFIVCVLLEGDFTVSNYSFEPPRNGGRNPTVFANRSTGILEAYCCESDGGGGRRRGASKPDNASEQAVRSTVVTFGLARTWYSVAVSRKSTTSRPGRFRKLTGMAAGSEKGEF
jgi:hypothetical protein